MSEHPRELNFSRLVLLSAVTLLVAINAGATVFAQPFAVNPHRLDPYKNSKFRVKWDGKYVYGVSYVSPLRRSTKVVEHRDGGDPNWVHKSPGTTHFPPIILRRGLTHDQEFEDWAAKVWRIAPQSGEEVALANFRKDIIIDLFNEAGQKVLSYKVYRCWPSEYQAWSELDADGNAVLIESLALQYEGWERDQEVTEPAEPN
jgi:phage tail-like protein